MQTEVLNVIITVTVDSNHAYDLLLKRFCYNVAAERHLCCHNRSFSGKCFSLCLWSKMFLPYVLSAITYLILSCRLFSSVWMASLSFVSLLLCYSSTTHLSIYSSSNSFANCTYLLSQICDFGTIKSNLLDCILVGTVTSGPNRN